MTHGPDRMVFDHRNRLSLAEGHATCVPLPMPVLIANAHEHQPGIRFTARLQRQAASLIHRDGGDTPL